MASLSHLNDTVSMLNEALQHSKPVTIDTKPLFDKYLSQFPPTVSELTFTNILCWTEVKHHLYCEYEEHLLISFRDDRNRLNFFVPIGPHPEKIMNKPFSGDHPYLWSRISEHLAHSVSRNSHPVYDRKNSDYVYNLSALRTLEGKKYDGKRNFIKRCSKLSPIVQPLTKEDVAACLQIQEQWLETQRGNPSAKNESTALMKALQYFDVLPLHGIGIFIEDTLAGFAIGEPLNARTFVEHFEKGLPQFTGIYAFLLQAFAQSIPDTFTHLNREQDIGIEGIRTSKESWNPEYLERKYTVRMQCAL